jgi:hypothetical protein
MFNAPLYAAIVTQFGKQVIRIDVIVCNNALRRLRQVVVFVDVFERKINDLARSCSNYKWSSILLPVLAAHIKTPVKSMLLVLQGSI